MEYFSEVYVLLLHFIWETTRLCEHFWEAIRILLRTTYRSSEVTSVYY